MLNSLILPYYSTIKIYTKFTFINHGTPTKVAVKVLPSVLNYLHLLQYQHLKILHAQVQHSFLEFLWKYISLGQNE